MQKIWIGTKTKVKASRKPQDKKTNLSKDQKQIVFTLKGKEKRVDITDITKVITADSDPEKFQIVKNHLSVEACFGLVTSTLDEVFFAAPSIDDANLWVNGLQCLIENASKNRGEERRVSWLKKEFSSLTKNGNDFVKYVNLLNFLTSQRMNVDPNFVKKSLKKFMVGKNKTVDDEITQEEFVQFLGQFLMRVEFFNLFLQTSSDGSFLTVEDLEYFLTKRQGESSVSRDDCRQIISRYEVTQEGRENGELGIDGFIKYMSSKDGELFNPSHDKVYQDMTQPIAHYFIASSHNTYLSGDQLQGDSSVEEYVKVLKEGCRCVELDCWDGDNGEPVVYHGHTLTSKILFKDIIEAVKKHAFEVSPYPVVLNMENHCSVEYQKKMARYLVEILGDLLHRDPVDKTLTSSPSPETFKYKIFVRAKKLKQEAEESSEDFAMDDDEDSDTDDDDDEGEEKPKPEAESNHNEQNNQAKDSTDGKKKKKQPKPIAKEFSLLVNYFANIHFVSFDHSSAQGQYFQSSSFSENKLAKFLDRGADVFVEYNKKQLSRIYPGGFRVGSGNYDPQEAWNVGCQIVALNHQNFSKSVQLHHGKFRQNGKCGFVLKPEFLRNPNIKFNPLDLRSFGNMARKLKVTIVSGYRLSPPSSKDTNKIKDYLDPYVVVNIYGVPADKFYLRTKTIKDNSYDPRWDEGFSKTIHVPELALVRFVVYDDDFGKDDFIGQSTVPFTSIRPGYRQIILLDKKGQPYTCGSLFVHVTITESDIEASSADSAEATADKNSRKGRGCTIA